MKKLISLGLHAEIFGIVFIPLLALQSICVTIHHLLQYITEGKMILPQWLWNNFGVNLWQQRKNMKSVTSNSGKTLSNWCWQKKNQLFKWKLSGVNLLSLHSFVNYLGTFNPRTEENEFFFQTQRQWKKRVKTVGCNPKERRRISMFLLGINSITYKIRSVKWKSERTVCG